MRGIRTAGVGLSLALSAVPALAQGGAEAPARASAATLGRLIPAGEPVAPIAPVTARGAAPDFTPPARTGALFPGVQRVQATTPAPTTQPPTTGGALPSPRPIPGDAPGVTQERTGPGGAVIPGSGTSPYPQYLPGVPLVATPGGMVPADGYQPGGVVVPQPCDGVGGTGVPCVGAPAATGGALFATPRLDDPGVGGVGGYSPLFPRVRGALDAAANPDRWQIGGEYLLSFVRSQPSPPLLTTSSPQFNGILGSGDTRVLYGGDSLTNTTHSGARFSGLYYFPSYNWAIDADIWFLGENRSHFAVDSSTTPVIARPFTNLNTGAPFAQIVTSPGLATGSAEVDATTRLWGDDIHVRRAIWCNPCGRVDALLGFKNFNLIESLTITERFARTPDSNLGIGAPTAVSGTVTDRFRTENRFYGVDVGLAGEVRRGAFFLNGKATVGLGSMYQSANVRGTQSITTTTGVTQTQGGLLALPGANIGDFHQTRFGVVPEVNLTLGVYVTPHLRIGVGYNLLYANTVVRPNGVVDTGLDVTRIPNFPLNPAPAAISGVRPSAVPLNTTDFFAQGLSFSLQWSY